MTLTVVDRRFVDNNGAYYFKNENNENFCWQTKSDRAFDELTIGKKIEAKYTQTAQKFAKDGIEYTTIKNVRF